MFLRDYERRLEPQLSSELGEPILRCIALNSAGTMDRLDSSTFWWRRPTLVVNGKPPIRLPQTMFLILTPTRVLITDVKTGFQPVLSSPILTLLRGDAEITTVQDDDGLWLYHLKSRTQSAELELEMRGGRGLAAELAGQLQEFSTIQPAYPTPEPTAPSAEPIVAARMLDARRRWLTKSYRNGGVLGVVLALVLFGFGAFQLYGYHVGTPTKVTIISCSKTYGTRSCWGTWTLDEKTYTGRIRGNVDDVQEGSSLDIRVHNGSAYAPGLPKWPFIGGAICAVIAVLLFLPKRLRFLPERRRPGGTGSARRGRHAGP